MTRKDWLAMTEAEKETERYRDLSRGLKEDLTHCREALKRIQDLASWHYDEDADAEDQSPEDMAAHVNGLIVRLCGKELEPDPTAARSGQNGGS